MNNSSAEILVFVNEDLAGQSPPLAEIFIWSARRFTEIMRYYVQYT